MMHWQADGFPDGIAGVGIMLAQVLSLRGHREEALQILDEAGAACHKLGNANAIAQVQNLRNQFRDRSQ
jgi:hypothetical protein